MQREYGHQPYTTALAWNSRGLWKTTEPIIRTWPLVPNANAHLHRRLGCCPL
ncbi:hypothetical protein FRUB_01439 [Fimbriiglobus ruber]|uniref:Uncharacterized protein n=1 Tax=Fimbriiglobus ruber TaxID=1908690 RepID=A0A225E2U6_9BACT|nr:hypothetical protein FRUB_01439 [Fimbriiglobus ruber]